MAATRTRCAVISDRSAELRGSLFKKLICKQNCWCVCVKIRMMRWFCRIFRNLISLARSGFGVGVCVKKYFRFYCHHLYFHLSWWRRCKTKLNNTFIPCHHFVTWPFCLSDYSSRMLPIMMMKEIWGDSPKFNNIQIRHY